MTIDKNDLLKSILESLSRIEHIKSEDIPDIDLYMDQVTTFMDQHLRATTRYPDEDKILTKTMINNYAKNDLLPPPVKKKYCKEPSSSLPGEEEIFQRARAGADLYLLFQGCFVDQRYQGIVKADYGAVLWQGFGSDPGGYLQ